MKLRLSQLAIAASLLALAGCGGGPSLGDKDASRDDLVPVPVDSSHTDVARPDEKLPVITAKDGAIYDVNNKPILMRGIGLQYAEGTAQQLDGVTAIAATGSNVVRLLINSNTTDVQLEKALVKSIEKGLVAIVTLSDPSLRCSEDITKMSDAVNNLWLKKWLTILAEDRFQSNIMINIADGWGPKGTYFGDYKAEYETYIKRFRKAGFKVPLVIDAPSCGQNFRGFMLQRGEAFQTLDPEKNVILSVQAEGDNWNTSDKIVYATSQMDETGVPYIISSVTGSGYGGKSALNHLELMQKAMGDHALQIDLPWIGTKATAAYSTQLAKPTNLKGGAVVSVNAYMDSDYLELVRVSDRSTPTGKTTIALYIKDNNGNRLKLTSVLAKDMRAKTWNAITAVAPGDSDQIDAANLMQGATTFDLANVTEVGVQVLANGKPETVKGKIKFDDIRINEGVPPVYVANFDSSDEEWFFGWGNGTVSSGGGALKLQPTGSAFTVQLAGWKGPSIYTIPFTKTLNGSFRMYVPAEYAGKTLGGRFYGQFGAGWEVWSEFPFPAASLIPGQWNDVKFKIAFNETVDPQHIGTTQAFGFELTGFSGTETAPILIDSMTISDPSAKKLKPVVATQYKYSFLDTEGFVAMEENLAQGYWLGASKMTVTAAGGELILTPNAATGTYSVAETRDIYNNNDINLSGPLTIKTKVFIPANYSGTDLSMHIYIQDGTWGGWFQTPDKTMSSFVPGQWNEVDFVINSFGDGFNTKLVPHSFGIQFNGIAGLNGGSIKLKDIEFIGTTYIDDSTPALLVDFAQQSDLAKVKFDFATDGFTESGLAASKSWGYKVKPFGWIASSWRGNKDLAAVLDLSISENVTDPKNISYVLTTRGDEILNSANGIRATSVLATFPPAKTN